MNAEKKPTEVNRTEESRARSKNSDGKREMKEIFLHRQIRTVVIDATTSP